VAAAVGDRLRFLRLQADLAKSTSSLGLLDEGSFSFRTIAEGTLLAVALARACPRSNFLVVGLSELFTNAVEHGNLGIATEEKERLLLERRLTKEIEARQDTPANRDKRVRVRFERRPGEIRIIVRDEGQGFDWRAFVDLEPSRAFRAYGRGIAMARRLCFDAIEYRDPGNEVVCVIRDRGDPVVPPVAEIVSPPPFPVAPDRAEVPPSRPPDPEDVRLARGMQAELMPQLDRLARIGHATGLRLSAFHEFSSDFGGDLWGIDLLDRDRVAVWLADFSGHGLSAALNTFRLHALISNFTEALGRPADFLAELNRRLVGALPVGQYATMLYGVVDLSARLFRYAAAAAPPPVAVESGTLTTGIGDGAGLPLGVARWSVYKEREMAFGPGSALLLASDALSEQPCEDGRRLGTAGVVDLVRRAVVHGAGVGCDVESVLAPFLSEVARPLRDDLTALCCFWPA
jgi:phosphoserine phosphatase RsbU/P